MKFKVGQTYNTKGAGKVKVLELNSPVNGGVSPIIVMTQNGGTMRYRPDGTIQGAPLWDIITPKVTGYINVYKSAAEANKYRNLNEVTIPIEYEAPEEE